jgi:flagellar biogenesis protein FliO
MLFRLGAGTVTVLSLCVVTLFVSKRWLQGPAPKSLGGSELQIVESVSLGNRCCVHLLRAGRNQLVVGVDGSGLKSLVALPELFEKSLVEAENHAASFSASEEAVLTATGTQG